MSEKYSLEGCVWTEKDIGKEPFRNCPVNSDQKWKKNILVGQKMNQYIAGVTHMDVEITDNETQILEMNWINESNWVWQQNEG